MRQLGIERLGLFGMPPPDIVTLAAGCGCASVGIGLAPSPDGYNPDGHRDWSLREDPGERRETLAVTRDTGVRIAIVEGFGLTPGRSPRDFARDLDLVAELGSDRINAVSIGLDMAATADGFAVLCDLAGTRGLKVSAEMGSLGPARRVEQAVELARRVGRTNFSLVIDTMHFFRLGNTADDFAALDPALVGYVQLADAPWAARFDSYMEEAMYERMPPGEGELPLAALLAQVPAGVTVSLEVPLRSLAERGVGPRERTARCVAAARALMAADSNRGQAGRWCV